MKRIAAVGKLEERDVLVLRYAPADLSKPATVIFPPLKERLIVLRFPDGRVVLSCDGEAVSARAREHARKMTGGDTNVMWMPVPDGMPLRDVVAVVESVSAFKLNRALEGAKSCAL